MQTRVEFKFKSFGNLLSFLFFVYHLILQTEQLVMIKHIFIYLKVYISLGPSVKNIFQGRNNLENAPSALRIDTYIVKTHIV